MAPLVEHLPKQPAMQPTTSLLAPYKTARQSIMVVLTMVLMAVHSVELAGVSWQMMVRDGTSNGTPNCTEQSTHRTCCAV